MPASCQAALVRHKAPRCKPYAFFCYSDYFVRFSRTCFSLPKLHFMLVPVLFPNTKLKKKSLQHDLLHVGRDAISSWAGWYAQATLRQKIRAVPLLEEEILQKNVIKKKWFSCLFLNHPGCLVHSGRIHWRVWKAAHLRLSLWHCILGVPQWSQVQAWQHPGKVHPHLWWDGERNSSLCRPGEENEVCWFSARWQKQRFRMVHVFLEQVESPTRHSSRRHQLPLLRLGQQSNWPSLLRKFLRRSRRVCWEGKRLQSTIDIT